MVSTESPIRAGLVFQQREPAEQLKRILQEAGIDLALELDVAALREGRLDEREVEVYIVNLESELEDVLDEVTELLDATDRPVVYNDAGVSGDLSGWDQARWARHLAAKIRKGRDTLPPPPPDAKPIPTPLRAAAAAAVAPAALDTGAAAAVEESAGQPDSMPAAAEHEGLAVIDAAIGADEHAYIPPGQIDLADSTADAVPGDLAPPDSGAGSADWFAAEGADLDIDLPPPTGEHAAAAAEPGLTDAGADLDWINEPLEELVAGDAEATAEQPSVGVDSDLDWLTEPLEGTAAVDELASPAAHSAEAALPGAPQDLELGLDLPQDLLDEQALDVALPDSPADLDDLSAFDETAVSDLDDLGQLEAPASDQDQLLAAELDAVFAFSEQDFSAEQADGVDLALDDATAMPTDDGIQGFQQPAEPAVVDGGFGELELLPELEELDGLEELSGAADDGVDELDRLLSSTPEAAASPGDAPREKSAGFSLADLPEWSLEPIEELEEPAASINLPEAVSTGLDLRDLDRSKPQPPPPPPPPPAAEIPDEEIDLDLGIDFVSMDLSPEPESPAPVTSAAPAPAAQVAAVAAPTGPRRVVVLGASIGGPDSIRAYLKALKADMGAAFLLVQHMGAEFLELMAQQLDRVSPLRVHLATHGRQLQEGEVLVAPVGKRLVFDAQGKVDLSQEAGDVAYSPSIDQVLGDCLERFGAERMLVIIFSGMANDAVAGARRLAASGVPIWAQDPASCVISSMVDGVMAAKVVSVVGTPEQLAAQTNKLLG